MVLDSPRIESRLTCRQGLSRDRVPSRRGPLPTAWHMTRAWLGAPQRGQTLVGRVPNKRLEPKANRISVRLCAGRRPGLAQQVLVDMQRFLHPYDHAILVWLLQLSRCCPTTGSNVDSQNFAVFRPSLVRFSDRCQASAEVGLKSFLSFQLRRRRIHDNRSSCRPQLFGESSRSSPTLRGSAPAHRARMEFLLYLEAGFNGRFGFEPVVVVGRFSLPYVEMCERLVVDDLRVPQHFQCMVQFVSD